MRSQSFTVLSSAGERATRDTVRHFEQVRAFFAQAMGALPRPSQAIQIVVFGSRKEYEPYRLNEGAAAYYLAGVEKDYIVMSEAGVTAFPIAVHEYYHLLVQHSGFALPPWLNEGLAELYSTLEPRGDKVLVGSLIPGRHAALLNDKWVPLATIVAVDHDSPYYNEKAKMGNFYNESWALAHMLALSPEFRPGFSAFLKRLAAGAPSPEALQKTYGKALPAIEKQLQQYLRGNRFQGALFDLKLQKVTQDLPATPTSSFDVALTLAELTNRPDRVGESRESFQRLIRATPSRPEPYAALGYLEWRARGSAEAYPHFRKAYELGGRSARFLWDYGRIAAPIDPAAAAAAVAALLELQPDRLDARLHLASLQLRLERPADALATLSPVKKVGRAEAPGFFRSLTYVQLKIGNHDEALTAARRWLDYCPPDDKDQAQRVISYLESAAQTQSLAQAPRQSPLPLDAFEDTGPAPPHLRRREQPAPSPSKPLVHETPVTEATGDFVEFDCRPPLPRLILQSSGKKLVFAIKDPQQVTVTGPEGGTVDLQCGPQTGKRTVSIEYVTPEPPQAGLDGLVSIIHFQP